MVFKELIFKFLLWAVVLKKLIFNGFYLGECGGLSNLGRCSGLQRTDF